jgi:hyperosmotically inducible protein
MPKLKVNIDYDNFTSYQRRQKMRAYHKTGRLLALTAFMTGLGLSSVAYGQSAGQYVDDATITAKVKAAYVSDSQLKAMQISVETNNGTVQLSGNVDSQDQEAEAVRVAKQVNGVKAVKDLIVVKGMQGE